MSSSGERSLITDNLVINNVYAVDDLGRPAATGKVLVTDIGGLMTYQPYVGAGVWYLVAAGSNVDMSGNSIIKCPNMVSTIDLSGSINPISLSSSLDGSGNKKYTITNNISAGTGITISPDSSGGLIITNSDIGSAWYTVPAATNVNFGGYQLQNVGPISGSGGIVDISGGLDVSGNTYVSGKLDISGNITGSGNIITTGDISCNTLNYTTLNPSVIQDISGGQGIIVSGSAISKTISANLVAGNDITIDTSGNAYRINVVGNGATQWTTSGNSIYYDNSGNGGNVGINTATPSTSVSLDVSGNIYASRYIYSAGQLLYQNQITSPHPIQQISTLISPHVPDFIGDYVRLVITMVGGGGGGGYGDNAGAGGGGSGQEVTQTYYINTSASITMTTGIAGTGGTNGNPYGHPGGTTYVDFSGVNVPGPNPLGYDISGFPSLYAYGGGNTSSPGLNGGSGWYGGGGGSDPLSSSGVGGTSYYYGVRSGDGGSSSGTGGAGDGPGTLHTGGSGGVGNLTYGGGGGGASSSYGTGGKGGGNGGGGGSASGYGAGGGGGGAGVSGNPGGSGSPGMIIIQIFSI